MACATCGQNKAPLTRQPASAASPTRVSPTLTPIDIGKIQRTYHGPKYMPDGTEAEKEDEQADE